MQGLLCLVLLCATSHAVRFQQDTVGLALQDSYSQLPQLGDPHHSEEREKDTTLNAVTVQPKEQSPEDYMKDDDGSDPPSWSAKGSKGGEDPFKDNQDSTNADDLDAIKNHIIDDAKAKSPAPDDDVVSGPDPVVDFQKAHAADQKATALYLASLKSAQAYADKTTEVLDWLQNTCLTKYCKDRTHEVNATDTERKAQLHLQGQAGLLPASTPRRDLGESGDAVRLTLVQEKIAQIHRQAHAGMVAITHERDSKVRAVLLGHTAYRP